MTDQENQPKHKLIFLLERWGENQNPNLPLKEQLLRITHHKEITDGDTKYTSYLADKIHEKLIAVLNSIPYDAPDEDPYFTVERKTQLAAYSVMYSGIMRDKFLSNPEALNKYIALIKDIVSFINKETSNDENLLKDVDFLRENLEYIITNQERCPEIVLHSMCYTIESLACAIIEKLLRIAYVNESKNIPEEKDDKTKKGDKNKNKNKSGKTLGTLLWDKKIEQIFNYDHLKSLQFLLSESNGIGLNIRNSLAH